MKCVKSPNVNCGSFNEQSELSHPDQVGMVFGPHILQYSQNLCQGCYDYIVRLPNALLFNIMEHLDLEDISVISRTCHRFKEVTLCCLNKIAQAHISSKAFHWNVNISTLLQFLYYFLGLLCVNGCMYKCLRCLLTQLWGFLSSFVTLRSSGSRQCGSIVTLWHQQWRL